jgi:hypothetical protein
LLAFISMQRHNATRGPAGAVCFSFTSDSDLRTGDGGKLSAKTLWSLFASFRLFVLVESDDHACVVAGLPLNLSSWSSIALRRFQQRHVSPQKVHQRPDHASPQRHSPPRIWLFTVASIGPKAKHSAYRDTRQRMLCRVLNSWLNITNAL